MEAIVNNLIKATGWSIFHSLWQGAIIYAILFLTVIAMPKLKAQLKHNLAYAAMCLIFVSFCITFFSIFKLPLSNGNGSGAELHISAAYYEYLSTLPQEISSKTETLFPYIVSVYGIGILFQLFILIAGYRKMHQLKNAAQIAVPAAWTTVFEEMVSKLNLKQYIGFYLSEKVNVPLVIGYFKPIVLFPVALATQLDIKQVEAILIHELSHIRRNDYLLNLIKTGIETILFFNPFIWLSGRFINIEREHACDDLVVQLTGTPVTYAHALLKLEILKDQSAPALSMAATGKNQHLYQRIKRITDMKTNYMNAKQQIFAITLTIATVISLAWVKPSKAEKPTLNTAPLTEDVEIAGVGLKFKVQDLKALKLAQQPAHLNTDTTKKKRKFKIVTVDANGNKQEYNSIKEVPDSLRAEVFNQTFVSFPKSGNFNVFVDSVTGASLAFMKSPEWKKNMADIRKNGEEISKHFNSPEWKKNMADIRKNGEEIKRHFNSPEWKKQQESILKNAEEMKKHFSSPEWKKQQLEIQKSGEEVRKYFDSPEWKKQQEEIHKNGEEMSKYFNSPEWKKQQEEIRKNGEEIGKYFNSPEWKKQVEEMRKNVGEGDHYYYNFKELSKKAQENKELRNSAEYKELKEKFDKEVEALKKKKEAAAPARANN
ncbi:peptidase M56 [Pedobacter steynii]|uniref:Peptidase M56 n=1 Tax=Pedobacter steynii TaxID=430522 RepID=A0A1D7QI15_9SPHI|nr:M56 family metallopeptidase [Pedobacter steynii]AOM78283.1 peptidase M56 [Pedobacter steynii]